ncbi:MAG: COX15/CtaA family protein [Gammaproteobacteria bacterium]|nr:COX15/CtaA family protein [Gammaproteobacteria bacterium]
MSPIRAIRTLTLLGAALAFLVIIFGAYVRLSNAGLSCPDWPGCYGKLVVPQSEAAISEANASFPHRPVDVTRAWLEMIHRYLASTLGLIILATALIAWRCRRTPGVPTRLALLLVGLVIFQGMLGMWTVTLLLKPIVVTGHLIGGILTFVLLFLTYLRAGNVRDVRAARISPASATGGTRLLITLSATVLLAQIILGGWTSTNYAALACPDFPTCQGQLIPELHLSEALRPWRGLGVNYEGGVLGNTARVTIHFLHRLGALTVLVLLLATAWAAIRQGGALKKLGAVLVAGVGIQISLGISNVVLGLPLLVAVAHTGGAALLLLLVLAMYHTAGLAQHERGTPEASPQASPA